MLCFVREVRECEKFSMCNLGASFIAVLLHLDVNISQRGTFPNLANNTLLADTCAACAGALVISRDHCCVLPKPAAPFQFIGLIVQF